MEKVFADIEEWKKQGLEKAELMKRIGEDEIGWPYCWGATGQKCTVANREARMKSSKISEGDKNLIKKRCQVLNGSKGSCAGCKYYADGQCTEMHDCIAFVNQLLDYAGVPHYGAGCSTMWNHEANWEAKGKIADLPEIPCLVFQGYPGNEKKKQHIGYYTGDGYVIHCSVEVKKQKLSEYPWSDWGLPKGMGGDVPTHTTMRRGDKGPEVKGLQEDLIKLGYDVGPKGADGIFGAKTQEAVKSFQRDHGLKVDGICGPATWSAIEEAIGPSPEPTKLYTVHIPHQNADQCEKLKILYPDCWTTEE
jgi:hypothetical protein